MGVSLVTFSTHVFGHTDAGFGCTRSGRVPTSPALSVPSISASSHPLLVKNEDMRYYVHFDRTLMRYSRSMLASRAEAPLGWFMIEPSYSCPNEELVGKYGDGVKWVCNPRSLDNAAREAHRKCVVYSFGSRGEDQFEQDISRITTCEIHTFDPTVAKTSGTLHRYAIGVNDSEQGIIHTNAAKTDTTHIAYVPMKRLSTIMEELKHDFADVMKMDTEGAEFGIITDMAATNSIEKVGQMQIEVHWWDAADRKQVWDLFDILNSHGMVVFHKENNIIYNKGSEYALLRLAPRPDLFRAFPRQTAALSQGFEAEHFFAEYVQVHKRERAACGRILVFDCNLDVNCGGLGDRVTGMVTSVMLSILTNRAFVVHQDFFHESFQPADLDVDWRWSPELESCTSQAPLFNFVNKNRNPYANFEELLHDHPVVRVATNRGNLHRFLDHPIFGPRFAKLGFNKCNMFGQVFDRFFEPTPALATMVQQFTAWDGELGQKPTLTVGIHLRLGDKYFNPEAAAGPNEAGICQN